MGKDILREGGPYKVQKTGIDRYLFTVPLPRDKYGRIARECTNLECSPGYFKVKPGTGITEEQLVAYCPYCRTASEPNDFTTKEQSRFGKDIAFHEVARGAGQFVKNALVGSSNRRVSDYGFIKVETSYKPANLPTIRRPIEEEVLRAVICPHCGLDQAVYGLATWCADCGKDIFLTHVEAEFEVVRTILSDVGRRYEMLGPRIAARDIENSLEDTVSIFETTMKVLLIRHLRGKGETDEAIQQLLNERIRNGFQNPSRAAEIVRSRMSQELLDCLTEKQIVLLTEAFGKRHPITHNLGIIDRVYLEKALAEEREGKEVRVTKEEILEAIEICHIVLRKLHSRLFP